MNKIKWFTLYGVLGLILASIILYVLFGMFALTTKIVFIITGLGIISYCVLNGKDIVLFFKKSGSMTGVYKIVQFLVIAGILVFIYLISDNIPWKLDLTSSRLYSFSDETKKVLSSITNDMKILYFRPDNLTGPYFEYQENLLKAYTDKNKRIKLTRIDPTQNRTMAIDYNITEDATVVFEYLGNKVYVPFTKIVEGDPQNGDVIYKGEQAYTAAIKSLLISKPKTVYVLTGHGEINPADKGNKGYRGIFERIAQDNIKLNQLNLLKTPEIPADCGLIIIGNPVYTFSVNELDMIAKYIESGGDILVLLEYETHITINDILRQMGLFYLQNLAVEDQDNNPQLGRTTIIPSIISSEITAPLIKNNVPVIMPTSVGILALGDKDRVSQDKYVITPLLTTSKYSFGEVSSNEIRSGKVTQDKNDLKGPLVTAFSVRRIFTNGMQTPADETNTAEARMVVFGDSDFVNNTYFQQYGNSDLLLNSVDFLLKREADITIRPKTSEITGFQLTGSQRRFLTVFAFAIGFLYLIPGIIIVAGRRRKVKG